MSDPYDLQRFIRAQDGIYEAVLEELRSGSKQSHWMWFIFPQLAQLGRSATAKYYGISCFEEAAAYLAHAVLGPRIRQSLEALLPWCGHRTAEQIFGSIDALKLRSSLTLFGRVEPGSIFAAALEGFFDGATDERTLALLNAEA